MVDVKHEEPSVEVQNTEPLGRIAILGYGTGHMLNDITSACWFTYLLLFLTDIGLSPRDAAIVMLSGQVADALTTIFAGELIDRFGHFKLWHAGGSVLVAISFSSVFGGCVPCEIMGNNSSTLQTIGYSLFAAIFNVGWAVTQVSHMHYSRSLLSMIWECLNLQRLWYLPLSTFAASLYQSFSSWTGSRLKAFFLTGSILWIFSGSGILVLPTSLHNTMYICSITIGIANALLMVTGISMQSMLVGKDLNGCGFVYGSLSFLDKLSCGLALYALESFQGSDHIVRSLAINGGYSITRLGLGLIPAACAFLSALVTCTMELEETPSMQLSEPLLV